MDDFKSLVQVFTNLGYKAIPLVVAIAFLAFIFGVGRFIKSTQSDKIQETKNLLTWGVIGLFVVFSVWGIVGFIRYEFFEDSSVIIPQLKVK